MTVGSPADRPLKVSDELVSALVSEQFPDLAHLDVGRHHTLEDHVSVRLGDEYGAIFPTVPGLDEYFARVTDLLAPKTPNWNFPWSGPIRTGRPSQGFPYHWVIVPWITASTAAFVPLRPEEAPVLGAALRELHVDAPLTAPTSPYTSRSLSNLSDEWAALVEWVVTEEAPEERIFDPVLAQQIWDTALATSSYPRYTWTHGNLEPRAVLSDQGHLAGLLLWHCYGAGNPEVDLGAAAILFHTDERADIFAAYGRLSSDSLARIEAFEVLAALRYIKGGDPFRARLAWERLIELGLVTAPWQ
jgi:aminoglycoside phosphotransferase (APT) family kinase protein